jgi:hypothetical protein
MGSLFAYLTALIAVVHPGFEMNSAAQVIVAVVALLLGSVMHLNIHKYALLAQQITKAE